MKERNNNPLIGKHVRFTGGDRGIEGTVVDSYPGLPSNTGSYWLAVIITKWPDHLAPMEIGTLTFFALGHHGSSQAVFSVEDV